VEKYLSNAIGSQGKIPEKFRNFYENITKYRKYQSSPELQSLGLIIGGCQLSFGREQLGSRGIIFQGG